MVEKAWPKRLSKLSRQLKRLQEELGADHDLVVLMEFLLQAPLDYGGDSAVSLVLAQLETRSRRLRRKCKSWGKRIFRKPAKRFVKEIGQRWRDWSGRPLPSEKPRMDTARIKTTENL